MINLLPIGLFLIGGAFTVSDVVFEFASQGGLTEFSFIGQRID